MGRTTNPEACALIATPLTGNLSEVLGNPDEAIVSYEHALRHNPQSIPAMNAISLILRGREEFSKAAEYLHQILKIDTTNGEAWGSLGMYLLPLSLAPPLRNLPSTMPAPLLSFLALTYLPPPFI